MNFDKALILAHLEEDNITRAYFRVRPLLTIEGDAQADAARLWPDHGCLRIVPDRNEQHTFKERMRTLGAYCVIDLTSVPSEANKIRTNKNYHPDRGESNQYILYSDTVRAVPEHTFFQVLDGVPEDAAKLAEAAITPQFFLRQENQWYGPVRKAAPETPSPCEESAEHLFDVPCPDGQTRVILCKERPKAESVASAPASQPVPASVPKAPHADEPLPIGKPLEILDASRDFEETLQHIAQPLPGNANLLCEASSEPVPVPPAAPSAPLTGTPLYRAALRTSVPQTKNKLQEIVANQWRIARNEPPAESLPAGTAMGHVENPVENACASLRAAWQLPESRAQVVDFLLSLEGMRGQLEAASGVSSMTPLQKVLHERLQDLEADRLTALVQLDNAKSNLEAYRQQVLAALSEKERAEANSLQKTVAALEERVETVKKQLNALIEQRNGLMHILDDLTHQALPAAVAKALNDAALTAPVHGQPLRMTPVSGSKTSLDELVQRVQAVCTDSGATLPRNDVIALLLLLAVSPRVGMVSPSTAAVSTLLRNIIGALGWQSGYAVQVSTEQTPLASQKPTDSTPCLLLSLLPSYAPIHGVTRLFLSRALPANAAYEMDPWPIYSWQLSSFVPAIERSGAPVSASSLIALLNAPALSDSEWSTLLEPILSASVPLSGAACLEMRRFIAAAAPLMEGGLPAAIDWALLMWVVPTVKSDARCARAVKALTQEYPLTQAKL